EEEAAPHLHRARVVRAAGQATHEAGAAPRERPRTPARWEDGEAPASLLAGGRIREPGRRPDAERPPPLLHGDAWVPFAAGSVLAEGHEAVGLLRIVGGDLGERRGEAPRAALGEAEAILAEGVRTAEVGEPGKRSLEAGGPALPTAA